MAKIIFPCPIADQGVKTAIPTDQDQEIQNRASYHGGFPSITSVAKVNGGLSPRLEDMNYILFALSNEIYEQQRGIVYTYEPGVVYMTGAILWNPNGDYFVKSLVDNNTTSDLTDTTKWQRMTVNETDFLGKANINLGNIDNTNYAAAKALNAAGIRTVVSTGTTQSTATIANVGDVTITVNYRIWSDGWCQQWGDMPNGENTNSGSNYPTEIRLNLPFCYRDMNTLLVSRSPLVEIPLVDSRVVDQEMIPRGQRNDRIIFFNYKQSDYGIKPKWITEGYADGERIFFQPLVDNPLTTISQLGGDITVSAGETLLIEGRGGGGYIPQQSGLLTYGGVFICRHKFPTGGTLKAYEIASRSSRGDQVGAGTFVTFNDEVILAAGGGAESYSLPNAETAYIGGAGYNGGATPAGGTPGYSYDGTEGDSTSTSGAAGAGDTVLGTYGGSGYVHPDYVSDTTTYYGSDATNQTYWVEQGSVWFRNGVRICRVFPWLD